MSYSCWHALGSPTLATSKTVLKAFDGHLFTPHGILAAFPIGLGGKTVTVEVEVVNAPLDYNLLLGRSWFYPMRVAASTFYRLVRFPHQGKIISIDHLYYCTPNLRFDSVANAPLVRNSHQVPELVGAGLFEDPCLMAVFPLLVPDIIVAPINMIYSIGTHLGDPWVIPNLSKVESYGDTMPLSPTKLSYSAIQPETKSNVCFSQKNELDLYSLSEWEEIPSSPSHDFLSKPLLSDESILEAMMVSERPWEDYHHRSSILPMVAMVNTVSSLSQKYLGSSDPQVVLSPIDSLLPISQDPIPFPSSSIGEHLPTSNHRFQRTKKKGGMRRKQKPNKKAPSSRYHAGHHVPLASTNHAGGKVPISSHCDGVKLANGYLPGT
jgi:hypothetical protein